MSITERLGQVWTAAVAYVALIIGAGLSITFNVVDVVEERGADVDRWDIVAAVAFPGLVVLMVEMFVSRLWVGQGAAMQILRWAGTVSIGLIAMRISWTHGHAFFLSRGQEADVANLGPIAVDLLAIMATALILSGRSRAASVRVARPAPMDIPATDTADTTQDLSTFTSADTDWLSGLGARIGDTDTTPAAPLAVPAARRTRVAVDTGQASEMDSAVAGLLAAGESVPDIKRKVSEVYSVSTKTVGRRIAALSLPDGSTWR